MHLLPVSNRRSVKVTERRRNCRTRASTSPAECALLQVAWWAASTYSPTDVVNWLAYLTDMSSCRQGDYHEQQEDEKQREFSKHA